MKSCMIILLCSSLLLEGCTSYFLASDQERTKLVEDSSKPIEIHLVDGSEITVDSFHYVVVSEPADFVYVVGERADGNNRPYRSFRGKITPPYIESVDTEKFFNSPAIHVRHILRLPDGSMVRFYDADFIAVRSDQGTGYWCAGNTSGTYFVRDAVSNRIPFDQIKSIEVQKLSLLKNIYLVIGISFMIALGAAGAALGSWEVR
jgi:hypothetical protein